MSQVRKDYKPTWPRGQADLHERQKVFDRLPKAIRTALNYADFEYCPVGVHKAKRKHKMSAAQTVNVIKENDRKLRSTP